MRNLLTLTLLAALATASSPQEAIASSLADANALYAVLKPAGKERDLHSVRYFWVFTPEGKERDRLRAAFRLHLNFLSRNSDSVGFVEVHPWLWRVDLDEMKLDRSTLEAAQHEDIYFHDRVRLEKDVVVSVNWPGGVDSRTGKFFEKAIYEIPKKAGRLLAVSSRDLDPKQVIALRELLFTEVPVLSAEWFLVQSARQLSLRNKADTGLGYYDFLRLKKRDDYFNLIKFRTKDAEEFGKEIRAVQEISGVSPAPRQLVRLGLGGGGAVWVALDTNNPAKAGIALNNLESGKFKHQIEEWYGFLPNGLPATFLSDDKGNRQNNAPADAVGFHDDSRLREGRDGRIHVNLACHRCHAGQVLLPIDDYVRRVFKSPLNLGIADKKRFLTLRSQYFSNLDKALLKDRLEYQEAFTLHTITKGSPRGLTPQKAAEAYARSFHAYADDAVTVKQASLELGVTTEHWKKVLEWNLKERKALDLRLSPFLADPPQPIQRVTWEDVYNLARELNKGYIPKEGAR